MRVLLINPPLFTSFDTKGIYPMGLGYIASMLRLSKCEVDFFDIRLYQYEKAFVTDFLKKNQGKYDIVGIGCMVTAYRYVKWLTHEIKRHNPGVVIVAGGSINTAGELLVERTDIDIVCVGEGEQVITAIVNAMRSNEGFEDVPNLILRRGNEIIRTRTKMPMEIDSIPYPAWDLLDMEQYTRHSFMLPTERPNITMMTERGCPFACTFCYRNFGRTIRYRSTESVVNEIKTLKSLYGIEHIDFIDEIFNADINRVKELCTKMIEEDLDVTWRCIGRTDLTDKEALQLMRAAGCKWIGYGIESGSQTMLDRMNKCQKVEDIEKSLRLSKEAGIIVTGTFIIGMPGETEDTIEETKQFFKRNQIFNAPFFPVPYPGTELYNEVKAKGLIGDEEEFICSLEKDAFELMINLTDMKDSRLVELRNELIGEFQDLFALKSPEGEKSGGASH